MNIVTLAPLSFAQLVDTMERTDDDRRYMHHYNAYRHTRWAKSDAWAPGSPQKLATAIWLNVPDGCTTKREEFPYAIRSVTEIMSQNGSTDASRYL